ncbi:MAG: tetratricopeptide repeat protein [Candidatus Paceibacterota bacterium]|nr:MAG: tetratricopeptide repeat protein [Candidatus Paceibacterota bacterium]
MLGSSAQQRTRMLMILGLCISVFFVYATNLQNPLFWDDTDWIVNNPAVHSISWDTITFWFSHNTLAGIGLQSNYYRPFLFFTFAINYVLHGAAPFGYHLVNNVLHIANVVLVFLLLERAFQKRFIPFVVAAIFGLHPLQTEAVTYVAGRGDPLHVFGMLAALWMLLKARETHARRWYIGAMVASVLALLSRETAVIFPLLASVYFLSFVAVGSVRQAIVGVARYLWPFFGISLVYGILRLTVLNFENTLNFFAQSNPYTESVFVRLMTFASLLTEYASMFLWPLGLHMERSAVVYTHILQLPVLIPVLFVSALIGLCVILVRRLRTVEEGRPNSAHLLFFALGWFFSCMALTSGITPVNALIYEHWLYLAMVGPLTAGAWAAWRIWERNMFTWVRPLMATGFVVAVIVFSILSIQRNRLWGDPLAFYLDILRYEPQSARINNNVGNIYYDRGEYARAEEYYWKAVAAEDTFPQPHYNIGSILLARNDIYGARAAFEKAVAIDPAFPYAYEGLASIAAKEGDLALARTMIQKWVELLPSHPIGYLNLGRIEARIGNRAEALAALEKGLSLAAPGSEIRALIEKELSSL